MPLVTFFSVLELPEKNRKGGCNNPPLVSRGINQWHSLKNANFAHDEHVKHQYFI